jgi:membrane-associated phospholipid phosphatase
MGGERRAVTAMWTIALFFLLLAAAGFAGLDRLLLDRLPAAAGPESPWTQGAALLDMVALRDIGDWLLPFILVFAGAILLVLSATRATGFPLVYVGLVQIVAYSAAILSRPLFGRVRPSEAPGGDLWFASGSAFPSGDTAFYAGLFLPLVLIAPRLWPLWLVPPLFVAAAGMASHNHYLSDASISIALAAALAALLVFIADKGRS